MKRTRHLPNKTLKERRQIKSVCSCVCSKQVEKEKRELARQYGMVRSEVSGGEIAEELEKERRSFQLSMCEVSDAPPSPESGS